MRKVEEKILDYECQKKNIELMLKMELENDEATMNRTIVDDVEREQVLIL